MTKKEFVDVLKEILGLPVQSEQSQDKDKEPENKNIENKTEAQKDEKKTELDTDKPEDKKEEVKAEEKNQDKPSEMDELKSILTDTQNRVTLIEGQLTEMTKANAELKTVQEKMNKVIEVIKNEPQSEEPKITDSSFSKYQSEQSKGKEDKLKRLSQYFK